MSEQPMKRCRRGDKCLSPNGPWLPATQEHFYKHPAYRDGLETQCKTCKKLYRRLWGGLEKPQKDEKAPAVEPTEPTPVATPALTVERVTAAGAFQRYPAIGTIEHLPSDVDERGLRWFDAQLVRDTMWNDVPEDLTRCDACNGGVTIDQVCPEGYAIYRCAGCGRRFRVVREYEYYFQEDL